MPIFYDIHTHDTAACNQKAIYNYMISNESVLRVPEGFFSAGVHPWDAATASPHWQYELSSLCKLPTMVAVGETGLDRLHAGTMDLQRSVFESHLKLASSHNLPLIIHCVRAHDEITQLLRTHNVQITIIFHGFENGWRQAVKLLDAGIYLSFGKALLNNMHPAAEAFKKTPPERVFLETDEYKGGIASVYEAAANLWQLPLEAVAERINLNVKHTFKINDRNVE